MKIANLPILTLIAGLASLTGCGNSASDSGPAGGSNSGAPSSAGGSTAGTSSAAAGEPGSGGTTASAAGSSGSPSTGGVSAGGGVSSGGSTTAGSNGGSSGSAPTGGSANAGGGTGGASGGAAGSGGSSSSATCTPSKAVNSNASGTGPHQVALETNPGAGIKEGTIFRPRDLGAEKYPIFVWGEGGCSLNGLSNSAAMAEIASHGYFVIADGTPNNQSSRMMDSSNPAAMGAPLRAYIDWAIAENEKPCSTYYHHLDPQKVAANGFSCGGLMSEGTAADPRIMTFGLNSSGLFAANQPFYQTIHTPVLIVLGGSSDIAYENGKRDFDNISALGMPILLFSKQLGHGGDLGSKNGGDFTKIDLAWLNWQLKADETATGKGLLVGPSCPYCSDGAWEVKSKNLP